jgi:hypothetical protein
LESSGSLSRHSLELYGRGVLFRRIQINGRYILSKAIDDFDGAFGLPMNNYNLNLERGASNRDQRHYFTANLDYSPFRDFTIYPSITIGSPTPYTITTGNDDNNDTVFNDRPAGVPKNSARGNWHKSLNLGLSWAIPILKRSVTVTRNGKEESIDNLPTSLKYHKLNFSLNIENVLNSTNQHGFVGNQLSPFFGKATFASPARRMIFGLSFVYF